MWFDVPAFCCTSTPVAGDAGATPPSSAVPPPRFCRPNSFPAPSSARDGCRYGESPDWSQEWSWHFFVRPLGPRLIGMDGRPHAGATARMANGKSHPLAKRTNRDTPPKDVICRGRSPGSRVRTFAFLVFHDAVRISEPVRCKRLAVNHSCGGSSSIASKGAPDSLLAPRPTRTEEPRTQAGLGLSVSPEFNNDDKDTFVSMRA